MMRLMKFLKSFLMQSAIPFGKNSKNIFIDYFPQNLELVIGDKIPDFLSFLEENLTSKEDFKQAMDFVYKNLCY